MNSIPLISIIVPIFNVEKYLNKCVDSIINQLYTNTEIILVDDGATDRCPQICDEYKEKDNRVKVIHKENGGLSDARNAGMSIASGEYIIFIDGDDYVDSKMIGTLVDTAIKDLSDVVSCGVKWVLEDGTIIREDVCEDKIVLDKDKAFKEIIIDGNLKQHVWNKLYKATLIRDIMFPEGKYHEDVFWSYQVFGKAEKTTIIPKSFYNYIQRDNSIMGEKYSNKRLDALDAKYNRCEYSKKNFNKYFKLSIYEYITSCMYHMQLALDTKSDNEIINNIYDRLKYCKKMNVYEYAKGKQRIWIRLFFIMPKVTCKLRNVLKIGK